MNHFDEKLIFINSMESLIMEGFKDQSLYECSTFREGLRSINQFVVDEKNNQYYLDEAAKKTDGDSILETILAEIKPDYKEKMKLYISQVKKK